MKEAVILAGSRTPIGDYMGALSSLSAVELGIVAAKSAMEKAGVKPEQVDELIAGHCLQAGCKGNTGRQVALGSGLRVESVSCTVTQLCPASMRATEIASQQIMLGKHDIEVVAGYESMSNAPYMSLKARQGLRMGDALFVDHMLHDGLVDAFNNYHMGITAENLADQFKVTREEQDEWSYMSHQRAVAAIKAGKFKDEIVPVTVKSRKGEVVVDTDEHPNANLTLEALASQKSAFKKDGTVTAGNASSLNDGGASLVLSSSDKAKELGLKPLAKIVATASAGCDPKIMGWGVVPAVAKALKYAGLTMSDIGLWELNEAFAAQVIACNRDLKIDKEIINVNGSGVSLGHPVGQTGCRLIVTLMHEMQKRNVKYGLASLCAGGGPAVATIIELIK